MSEFKAITTQEELDAVIGERLRRERESVTKNFAPLKEENETLKSKLAESQSALETLQQSAGESQSEMEALTAKVKSYETESLKTRIALEMGLPYELSARITGDDEKAMREDAKILAGFVTKKRMDPPLKSTEEPGSEGKDAAYKALLNDIGGQ